MIDYYKILNLKRFDLKNLQVQFKVKINNYRNLPFYSKKIKKELQLLKEAYYVLSNIELVKIYNLKLKKDNKFSNSQKLSRDDLRNNKNKMICSRNFAIKLKKEKNIENEEKLKKIKININKKNENYINE